MIAPGTTQTIEARVVPLVRKGVWHAVKADIWDADDKTEPPIDSPSLLSAFASLEEARALFEFVGFVDEPEQADLLVDLSRWPILLAVLESERDREVRRLQDLAVDSRIAPLEDLRFFDALISAIQEQTGAPPRARGDKDAESLSRPAPARKRRSRGDG
jgi:hypothetical protein